MTTARHTMIELTASAMDSMASAIRAYDRPKIPASSLTIASATFTESPAIVARTLRWRRGWFIIVMPLSAPQGRRQLFCQQRHDRLLHMQTVFRLVKDCLLVRLKNVRRKLVADIRRQ